MTDAQPRAPSGTFAPKPRAPEPAGPPTAAEIIARQRGRTGYLIPQPLPWAELNSIITYHGRVGEERSGQWLENTTRLQAIKGWIDATARHPECTRDDLWRIWQTWNPMPPRPKEAIRGWFDGIDRACLTKQFELAARREKEQQPERARQGIIGWADRCRSALEAHDLAREPLAADLEKAEAALQALDAPQPAEVAA